MFVSTHVMDNPDGEDDRELLSCWPPPSPESNTLVTSCPADAHEPSKRNDFPNKADSMPHRKRLKVGGEKDNQHVPLADVALARWWRNHQKSLLQAVPQGLSGPTLLLHIAKLPAAKDFMRSEVHRLGSFHKNRVVSAAVHKALGTLYERLNDLPKAFDHLHTAVTSDPSDKETAWLLERVLRQLNVLTAQATAASRLSEVSRDLPPMTQVERRSAETLSYEEFLLKYAMSRTPVVITGLSDVITSTPWTLDHIRNIAGSCRVETRRMVPGSAEWARLEPGPELSVSQLITRIQHPAPGEEQLYLFDWSLPLHCPQLAQQLTIPKYFAGDLLQRTSNGALYQDSWPSLFVAPSGLRSELHVDAFGSNFWMALLAGKKRWIFFSPKDAPLLYPRYCHSLDPVFDADLGEPDLDRHPLLTLTQPKEVILQEGELLFVPAGCPHRVENLTDSLAISANFVDLSNLGSVRAELTAQALVDPRAADLLSDLLSPDLDLSASLLQHHLPFSEFKQRPRGKSERAH